MKPIKGGVVVEYMKMGVPIVYYKSHRDTRSTSIEDFLEQEHLNSSRWSNNSWRHYYNRGYRCVRVTLTEDKGE